MTMTKRFCYLAVLSAMLFLTACSLKTDSNRLDDYPLSEIELAAPCSYPSSNHAAAHVLSPYVLYGDVLHVRIIYVYYEEAGTKADWEYGYILEKWDGSQWHTLYHYGLTETPDSEETPDILQHSADGASFEADFEQVFSEYGAGLYRVIRKCNAAAGYDGPFYCAQNVQLIDTKDFENGITFQELFGAEECPADIILKKGKDTLELTDEDAESIFQFISQMHCVATGTDNSRVGLGSVDHEYHVCFLLSDGNYFIITPFSGKTLDGKSYSAICRASGMAGAIYLYDKDNDLRHVISPD
ncbi:MAG: hypothetical protein HDR08_05295 [Lachnospiraceae bacterium]|nr:hypothetical protein [Lachnospiraceae bacterium]